MFWILTFLSPLSWVSESFRQDTGQWPVPFSSDEALQIGGLFPQGQFPRSGYGARRVQAIFQISTVEADVNLRLLSYRTAYRSQWNLSKWNCSGSHCSGVGYHRKCWSSAFFWMFKPYEFKQRLKRVNHMWQDNIQNPNATQYCSTVTVK